MAITLDQIHGKKAARRKTLQQNLDKILLQLKDMGALKVILFGSFARGRVRSRSDLDIISVMPSTRSGKEWMGKIYAQIERSIECDILAYTREELNAILPVSRFVRHAVENGRVIYERKS